VSVFQGLACAPCRQAIPRTGCRLSRAWSLAVFAGLLLTGCSTLQGGPRAPAGVDLSGEWRLNEELSDSVEAVLDSVRNELDPVRKGRATSSGVDASGRIVSRRDEFYGPPRTREMLAMLKQPTAFSLTQSARSLTLKSVDGTTEYVFGEDSVVSVPDGLGDQHVGWAGRQLSVGIRAVDGRRIGHLLGLSADRAQLLLTTTVSGGGLPEVTLRRTYDRVTPG
jgi:hypothetical protein